MKKGRFVYTLLHAHTHRQTTYTHTHTRDCWNLGDMHWVEGMYIKNEHRKVSNLNVYDFLRNYIQENENNKKFLVQLVRRYIVNGI